MRLTVENLRHELDVFLWENPDWADAAIVFGEERGGYVYARRVKRRKEPGEPFNIKFEEKYIYQAENKS